MKQNNFKNIIILSIVLMFLTSCSSVVEKEIVIDIPIEKEIFIPLKKERPHLEEYKVIFLKSSENLIAFNKKNADILNKNQRELLNYIKEIEAENDYFRAEILEMNEQN